MISAKTVHKSANASLYTVKQQRFKLVFYDHTQTISPYTETTFNWHRCKPLRICFMFDYNTTFILSFSSDSNYHLCSSAMTLRSVVDKPTIQNIFVLRFRNTNSMHVYETLCYKEASMKCIHKEGFWCCNASEASEIFMMFDIPLSIAVHTILLLFRLRPFNQIYSLKYINFRF